MKTTNSPSILAFLLAVFVAVTGCQTTQVSHQKGPIPESTRAQMGRVAVQWESNPNYEVNGITPNKFSGAGKGSLNGALGGTAVALEGGPIGIFFLPVFAAAGAGIGAVAGAVVADDASTTRENAQVVDTVLRDINREFESCMEMEFSKLKGWSLAVNQAGSELGEEEGVQSRLVFDFGRFQASDANRNSPRSMLSFSLRTEAGLYLNQDDYPIEERAYAVCTNLRPLSAWAADNGQLLRSELSRLTRATVSQAVDDFFREGSLKALPVYPQPQGFWGPKRINTLEPTFYWTLQDAGQEVDPTIASSLTYEMLLIDAKGNRKEFKDLDTNSIKVAIEPNGFYRWRVRAKYHVRDQVRTTPWTREQAFRSPKG